MVKQPSSRLLAIINLSTKTFLSKTVKDTQTTLELVGRGVKKIQPNQHYAIFLWGAGNRTENVVVTVSKDVSDIMDDGENRCGYLDGEAEQFNNLITCDEAIVGRFVQLQLLANTSFHIYEVDVHGI